MVIVSRDAIRFEYVTNKDEYFKYENQVFRDYVNAITAAFLDGHDCVADATQISHASRHKLINALKKLGFIQGEDYEICYICFRTPLETCLARNKTRIGIFEVPEEEIVSMHSRLTFPSVHDGQEVVFVE